MRGLYITLAVIGVWLALAAYRALLCPPRWFGLTEPQMLGVLLTGMLGGLTLVLIAAVRAVAAVAA